MKSKNKVIEEDDIAFKKKWEVLKSKLLAAEGQVEKANQAIELVMQEIIETLIQTIDDDQEIADLMKVNAAYVSQIREGKKPKLP